MLPTVVRCPPIQVLQVSLGSMMKSFLLFGIGVLYMIDQCMAAVSKSDSHDDRPPRGGRDGRGSKRRHRGNGSKDLFQKFAKVPTKELVKEAGRLFGHYDDYLDHDPKVWADLKEEHVAVLVSRAKTLSKDSRVKEDILTEKDMLTILKARKSSEPCALIGSSVFETDRVTPEMLKYIDFGCYEVILGKRSKSSRSERGDRDYDHGRKGESRRPFSEFYRRSGKSLELPDDVVKRYVESRLQMSQLRARSSSSHGDSDLQSCGMLGLYSKPCLQSKPVNWGWSCFQAAIEAEHQFEKLLGSSSRRDKRKSTEKGREKRKKGKKDEPKSRAKRDLQSDESDGDKRRLFDSRGSESMDSNGFLGRSRDGRKGISPDAYRLDKRSASKPARQTGEGWEGGVCGFPPAPDGIWGAFWTAASRVVQVRGDVQGIEGIRCI